MSSFSSYHAAACLPPGMVNHKPEFKRISVDRIATRPGRLRAIDPATVDLLADSIRRYGLLQPIGVQVNLVWRADPFAHEGEQYLIVWGLQRAAAVRRLLEAALREGDTNTACRYAEIPAYVFDEDTPADFIRRFEIVENLHRSDCRDDVAGRLVELEDAAK